MVKSLSKRAVLLVAGLAMAMAAMDCGAEAPEPTERIVTVPVEVEKIVEVEKVVEVERVVTVTREVPVEVRQPQQPAATPQPTAAATPAAPTGPAIYKMGLFEDPISRNTWNYLGGPAGSVWTGYVIGGYHTSLYGYSPQRFDWVPAVADGLPTPLARETVDGTEFWTTEVSIKQGVEWSDGEPLTADDFVFTVSTVRELNLGSNWASLVHPAFVDRAEALDDHRLKIYFKSTDEDGNAQTPGLSIWQFGLAFMPILPEHYWAPVVEEARTAGEVPQQIEALFAHVPDGEPTANGLEYGQWEPGAFFENAAVPGYFSQGTQVTEYANGAYVATNDRLGYTETYYGEPTGETVLELEIGPHFESEIFSIYGNQDSAILALTKGDIDFLFNPLGLEKGFLDRVRQTADLQVVENLDNGVFYLGFNTRKPPMNNQAFRQAVATVIDKEFVTRTILQDTAIPMYAMVPEGNAFWYNDATAKIGQGLGRGERIAAAVELLKGAGFTYEKEPEVSEDGAFVVNGGEGLRMPDGTEVPELELIAPSAGYDPLRSTFAIWIERWLNDLGIPTKARLLGFNLIVEKLFSETADKDLDMWILGWGFTIFPNYLENIFHSRHAPENEDGGVNWGGYANPEFDALAAGLLSETTIEGAREKAYQMQALLADDLPYVTLFTTPKIDVFRPTQVEFPYTSVLGGMAQAQGLQHVVLIK